MTNQDKVGEIRAHITKEESDSNFYRVAGDAEKYIEAFDNVEALELRLKDSLDQATPAQAAPATTGQASSMPAVAPPGYVFRSHVEAEQAIQALAKSGFEVKKLSLVGKGYHSEEHPLGFYTTGDRIKAWGGVGAFWGGIWGVLFAPAVFFIPGLGLLAMAGPLVAAVVGGFEGAVVIGGLSALGAALTQIGVPRDQVIKFETALKVDGYVLLVHGTVDDAARVGALLRDLPMRPADALKVDP